jgi:hypothetical protein
LKWVTFLVAYKYANMGHSGCRMAQKALRFECDYRKRLALIETVCLLGMPITNNHLGSSETEA